VIHNIIGSESAPVPLREKQDCLPSRRHSAARNRSGEDQGRIVRYGVGPGHA
jgi:hypothetical protein